MKTRIIVNPNSAAGRTAKHWRQMEAAFRRYLSPQIDAVFTEKPMHAATLCRESIGRGYRRIIAVGGDGTVNEVLNGFFKDKELTRDDVEFGILEMGTGGDFVRSLNYPPRWEDAIVHLSNARPKLTDVGYAEFRSLSGEETSRYFLNILDFGIGGAVVERVNRNSKRLGGRISFLTSILLTLFEYQNKVIRYRLNDGHWQNKRLNNFILANGGFFGGGLNPAPHAKIDDGLFDVVLFGDIKRTEAIGNLSNLRRGTHLKHPKISLTRAAYAEAASDQPVFVEMDGELAGTLPVKVSILPRILPLLR